MNVIQIGTNNGIDPVNEFLHSIKNSLKLAVLIEPMPPLIEALKDTYKNLPQAVIENIGIVDDPTMKSMPFYYQLNSNYETSSFRKEHLLELGCKPKDMGTLEVPVLTFAALMEKYKLNELDHLFIDAEGYDYRIIKSIDFSKYKIKEMTFECSHVDGTDKRGQKLDDLAAYLTSIGYKVSSLQGPNVTAKLL
jgi:FkbM family methyltransferase